MIVCVQKQSGRCREMRTDSYDAKCGNETETE